MIQNLKDLENQLFLLPEPTYFYKIGDRVTIGALQDVYVSNIFYNGKGYEIDYTSINNNYGRPIINEHKKRIVTWLDIRKYNKNTESLIENHDLFLNYSQRSITDIFSKVYYFGVDMTPEYQRDYVWGLADKESLIDSIFHNIDIGKFVYNKLPIKASGVMYEIIDGKQRINAICEFYEDRFKYKNKYFSELSIRDQDHFDDYSINTAEITVKNKKQLYQIFLMLNTSGKVMDKEHLDKIKKMYEEEI